MYELHMSVVSSTDCLWVCYQRLVQSLQSLYTVLFATLHCSMMFLRVKMWFVHPLPFRNPACSFLSTLSTAVESCLIIILQILLGTDSKVMPHQLLQLVRSPFLGIFTMVTLHQLSRMFFFQYSIIGFHEYKCKRSFRIIIIIHGIPCFVIT